MINRRHAGDGPFEQRRPSLIAIVWPKPLCPPFERSTLTEPDGLILIFPLIGLGPVQFARRAPHRRLVPAIIAGALRVGSFRRFRGV